MDKLAEKIASTREAVRQTEDLLARHDAAMRAAAEKYSETERYLSNLRVELQALEDADRLRPERADAEAETPAADGEAPSVRRGGRQPGSISVRWRQALSDIVAAGNQPVDQQQFYLLTRARVGLAETSVRERMRQYAVQGILIEIGGKFSVSEYAIGKWKLGHEPSAALSKAPAENTTAPH